MNQTYLFGKLAHTRFGCQTISAQIAGCCVHYNSVHAYNCVNDSVKYPHVNMSL